ncbi:hypothetical protein MNBD_PLANCTO03-591 [hydrothermal vent metagenome]|uniref:Uncharacterized protein n=1 Tax=hydrothermal vent metagenome TaxID=652676 RepID=A0A3B1DBD5_9ZZZZ
MESIGISLPMALVGLVLCAIAFIPDRTSRMACFLRGLGMQAIVVLPVGVVQFLWIIEQTNGYDFPVLVFGPLAAIPFNVGGLVCAAAFESVARAGLLEEGQSTLLGNLGVYAPMLAVQASLAAGIIAARIRATGHLLADRTILATLGVVLANSVLGVSWPWWGG